VVERSHAARASGNSGAVRKTCRRQAQGHPNSGPHLRAAEASEVREDVRLEHGALRLGVVRRAYEIDPHGARTQHHMPLQRVHVAHGGCGCNYGSAIRPIALLPDAQSHRSALSDILRYHPPLESPPVWAQAANREMPHRGSNRRSEPLPPARPLCPGFVPQRAPLVDRLGGGEFGSAPCLGRLAGVQQMLEKLVLLDKHSLAPVATPARQSTQPTAVPQVRRIHLPSRSLRARRQPRISAVLANPVDHTYPGWSFSAGISPQPRRALFY
jgi:hypothetical protein